MVWHAVLAGACHCSQADMQATLRQMPLIISMPKWYGLQGLIIIITRIDYYYYYYYYH
jgi:hypothetical protein